MSRSVKIKKPKWTDPEDRAYLSFFGTLLHSLRMEEVRLPRACFDLRRRTGPSLDMTMEPRRALRPIAAVPREVTKAQEQALQAVGSAAEKAGYVPSALPGNAGTLVIDMTKITDNRVPVYARRSQ